MSVTPTLYTDLRLWIRTKLIETINRYK